MRAHELFEDDLEEGELIPLPQWVIIVPGGSYDTYQISKMLSNPYMAHKLNFEYRNAGDFTPGSNPDQPIFTFNDKVAWTQAQRVLQHFKIPYATREGNDEYPCQGQREYTDDLYRPGK